MDTNRGRTGYKRDWPEVKKSLRKDLSFEGNERRSRDRRRGLKFNVGKNKVMVMNGVEGLECEVHEDGLRLKHVPEFEYLDEAGTDGAECSRKIANGRREAGAIRSLVNCRDLQIECARVLHERLLVPVLKYGSKTMLWK